MLLALTPSVSDAEARVHGRAAAHGVVDTAAPAAPWRLVPPGRRPGPGCRAPGATVLP